MSEWISPAACHAVRPAAQVPGLRRLGLAGGEERDQLEQRERLAHDPLRPDSLDAELRAHRRGVLVLELGELGLDARGHRHRARALRGGVLGDLRGDLLGALVHVGDEQHRLARQRAEVARGVRRLLGHAAPRAPAGPPAAPSITSLSHASSATATRSPPRACLADALHAALGLLEVGEHELRLDRLDVAQRVDAALGVHHVLVAVGAHDVHDRVGLADVREEAVAEALALVRARHEPGDVVEVDRVPHDLRGAHGARHLLQALVAHRHHRDVRLDRRERVVGRLGARFGERVEQRGLARVGHAHDADPRAHRGSS